MAIEKITKEELLQAAEDYADEAIEYMELFVIACDLLDEYVPQDDVSWLEFILSNHKEYKEMNYS